MAHRNSYQNQELHHLYEIIDRGKDDYVFKYGICCKPIDSDGNSCPTPPFAGANVKKIFWFRVSKETGHPHARMRGSSPPGYDFPITHPLHQILVGYGSGHEVGEYIGCTSKYRRIEFG